MNWDKRKSIKSTGVKAMCPKCHLVGSLDVETDAKGNTRNWIRHGKVRHYAGKSQAGTLTMWGFA